MMLQNSSRGSTHCRHSLLMLVFRKFGPYTDIKLQLYALYTLAGAALYNFFDC